MVLTYADKQLPYIRCYEKTVLQCIIRVSLLHVIHLVRYLWKGALGTRCSKRLTSIKDCVFIKPIIEHNSPQGKTPVHVLTRDFFE